ncbi:MAG: methionine--tRNA ligase [Clostridia bacterium]|nr:methionine--tRNA ligase [Clostridia bacterium]
MDKKPYYITTAIAYASAKPHIGNAYEIVFADALARWKRWEGYDVFFQTGTDEHGEKIQLKAEAKGVSPKAYVDEVSATIQSVWRSLGVEWDKFIRTTDEYHERQVQKMFRKFYEQGDIYKGAYEGWYCTPCESFWTESQLVDGKCPDCGREVKKAQEEAYFFRMSKYADKLLAYYEAHPEFITPASRRNEMINNFLKPGLQDLCVSRTSFTWGIPVDFDAKHVTYVWLDALTNYITGIGYDADGCHDEKYRRYWPADVHVIGKDIVRFHTIYWPIFLMALGEPLPKCVFGHPWLLSSGGKMSKSLGNVLYPDDMAEIFGCDAVRYYLLSQVPFDNDGLVALDMLTDVCNTSLANVYGNLLSRTVAMCRKYFGGKVVDKGVAEPVDEELKAVATAAFAKVKAKVEEYRFADALSEIFAVFTRANKYIDETAPWVLARDEASMDRLSTVLYNLVEALVIGTSILRPFLPSTADNALAQLGVAPRAFTDLGEWGLYPSGNEVKEGEKLFVRMDGKDVEAKYAEIMKKYEPKEAPKAETPAKPTVGIEDFAKLDLRVGKVLHCEKLPKAKKLLVSQVDLGEEKPRTIVSGIALYYTPEEMVGKTVVVVANLAPAKLCGVTSEGMILCATDAEGKVVLVSPIADVPAGGEVR